MNATNRLKVATYQISTTNENAKHNKQAQSSNSQKENIDTKYSYFTDEDQYKNKIYYTNSKYNSKLSI